jgi:hypothetical protein
MGKGVWLGAMLLAIAASAQGQPVATVGEWMIFDDGDTCSMQSGLPDRTQIAFSIGKNAPDQTEMRVGHANWRSLAAQPNVKVDLLLNGARQMIKPVPTFSAANATGVTIPFSTARAQELFTRGATVTVRYRSTTLLIVPLNGSAAAFHAVSQCAGVRLDPFAAG